MSLLPELNTQLLDDYLEAEETTEELPTKTYRINFGEDRIGGFIDGEDALRQFIVKAIRTPRAHFTIYSDDWGSELETLIGNDVTEAFIRAEIPRMVTEALIYDDRVNDVLRVDVRRAGDAVFITATVASIYGDLTQEVMI